MARQHRAVARELGALAGELAVVCEWRRMTSGRWPIRESAPHFERFVRREEELVSLLRTRLEEDRHLLGMMRRR